PGAGNGILPIDPIRQDSPIKLKCPCGDLDQTSAVWVAGVVIIRRAAATPVVRGGVVTIYRSARASTSTTIACRETARGDVACGTARYVALPGDIDRARRGDGECAADLDFQLVHLGGRRSETGQHRAVGQGDPRCNNLVCNQGAAVDHCRRCQG